MPPPTGADLRAEIIREVGDPNGTLATALPVVWNIYADKAGIAPRLQFLYSKRAALDTRLAEEQPSIDFTVGKSAGDVQDMQSQRFAHLQEMRDACQCEIIRIEAIARAGRIPATGAITKVQPDSPSVGQTSANDLIGSPYRDTLKRN